MQRGQQARGETTYEISMLAKLERRTSELVAKLNRCQRLRELGETQPLAEQQACEALRTKIRQGARELSVEISSCQDNMEGWLTCVRIVANETKKRANLERVARRDAQKKSLALDWEQEHGRDNYRKARPPPPPPTMVLRRPDGTMTANPTEMMELVDEAWITPVFCKHPQLDDEQKRTAWISFAEYCEDAFRTVSGRNPAATWDDLHDTSKAATVVRSKGWARSSPFGHDGSGSDEVNSPRPSFTGHGGEEFPLPRLTASRLRERMHRMTGKAVGPDGWAAEELLLLPAAFWGTSGGHSSGE